MMYLKRINTSWLSSERLKLNIKRHMRKERCDCCGALTYRLYLDYSLSGTYCCTSCRLKKDKDYIPIFTEQNTYKSNLTWAQEHAQSEGYWPDGTGYRPDEY